MLTFLNTIDWEVSIYEVFKDLFRLTNPILSKAFLPVYSVFFLHRQG